MFSPKDLAFNLGSANLTLTIIYSFYCCRICTETCYDTGGRTCGFSWDTTIYQQQITVDPAVQAAQLNVLKEQLKSALAEVEKQREGAAKSEKK